VQNGILNIDQASLQQNKNMNLSFDMNKKYYNMQNFTSEQWK
jgi:hypothetical protein